MAKEWDTGRNPVSHDLVAMNKCFILFIVIFAKNLKIIYVPGCNISN